jgi:hypothetical protein
MENQPKKREILYEQQGGKCFYCGCLMVKGPHAPFKELPPNAATLEHLHSRLNPVRKVANPKVVACASCNFKKGKEYARESKAQRKTARAAEMASGNSPWRGFMSEYQHCDNCEVCKNEAIPCETCRRRIHEEWHKLGMWWVRAEECHVECPGRGERG